MGKKRGRPRKAKNYPAENFEMVGVDSALEDTCTICYAEFVDPQDLLLHYEQVHGNAGIKPCDFCAQKFPDDEKLVVHIRNEHLCHVKVCKYCTRCYLNDEELHLHMKQHHEPGRVNKYACSVSSCGESFNLMKELELHELEHHSDASGVLLHKYFPLLSSVLNVQAEQFIKSIGSDTAYICQKCTYSNTNLERYMKHLIKLNCRTYSCDKCSFIYSTLHGLKKHLSHSKRCSNTAKASDFYKRCSKCDKEMLHTILKEHRTKCQAIKCQLCNLIFPTAIQYADHHSKHHLSTVALLSCKYCHKSFVGDAVLEKHIDKIHGPSLHLYKYKCIDCDVLFKHPKDLFTHFFRHHPDFHPFLCKICDKSFKLRQKFTIHIKLEHQGKGTVKFNEKSHVIFSEKTANESECNDDIVSDEGNGKQSVAAESGNGNNDDLSKCEDEETDIVNNVTDDLSKVEDNVTDDLSKVEDNVTDDLSKNEEITKMTNDHPDKIEEIRTKSKNAKENETKKVENKENQIKVEVAGIDSTNESLETERLEHQNEMVIEYLESSSDDEPLLKKVKKEKRPKRMKTVPTNQGRLICKTCNKKCYTVQHYKSHISMHQKNKPKQCFKCKASFKSEIELKSHVAAKHGKSELTETLKRVRREREMANQIKKEKQLKLLSQLKNANTINNSNELKNLKNRIQSEEDSLEMFKNTIKKVIIPKSDVVAKLTEVKTGISKYIETFTPEVSAGKKEIKINSTITIQKVDSNVRRPPAIKMYKFKPAKPVGPNVKLALPVKCKFPPSDGSKAVIKVIQDPIIKTQKVKKLNFGKKNLCHYQNETYEIYEHSHVDDDEGTAGIPEVAEEVMLASSEETPKNKFTHKIIIPHVSDPKGYEQIRIAHLLPEAPYYKIVKVKDILQPNKPEKKEDAVVQENIELPAGTKLVNVNPLAHLLKDTDIPAPQEKKAVVRRKPKKETPVKNYQKAVAAALLKLENTKGRAAIGRKKSCQKNQTQNNEQGLSAEITVTHNLLDGEKLEQTKIKQKQKEEDKKIKTKAMLAKQFKKILATEKTAKARRLGKLNKVKKENEDTEKIDSKDDNTDAELNKTVDTQDDDQDEPTEIEYLEEFYDEPVSDNNPGLSLPEL